MSLDDRINEENSGEADSLAFWTVQKKAAENELRDFKLKQNENRVALNNTLRDYRSSKRQQRYFGSAFAGVGIVGSALAYPAVESVTLYAMLAVSGAIFLWNGTHGKYLR